MKVYLVREYNIDYDNTVAVCSTMEKAQDKVNKLLKEQEEKYKAIEGEFKFRKEEGYTTWQLYSRYKDEDYWYDMEYIQIDEREVE